MLNSFRSLAGSIWAKILLIFLVLTFAVWGIGDMLRNPDRNVSIATVGSESISSEELLGSIRREVENLRHVMGDNFSPEMLKSINLPENVLQNLVKHKLLKLECEALGLVPSDADVVRRIRSMELFHDANGNFDKAVFEGTLEKSHLTEQKYVDQLRDDMALGLLIDTLATATPVPEIAAKTLLAAREEGRSVRVYTLSPSVISGIPQPDETQVKAYYDSHNREFTAPEFRNISYITITTAAVHADQKMSEEELKSAYQERLDEFKHAERRAIEQMLFSSEDKAKKASERLKSGAGFEQVAKESDIVNKNSLSLGTVEKANVLENAADTVFSLKAGEHTDPIQSPFGWHIFRVTHIEPQGVTPFDEARVVLEKDMKQHEADDALSKLAVKVEDNLAGGNTLQEAAQDAGLKVASLGPINHLGEAPDSTKVKDLPEYDKFLDTVFKTDEKSESQLMTSKGGIYYIVRVDKIVPERLRSLDEVRGLVVAGWQKEERQKRLQELAKDIGTKFLNASDRNAVIEKYKLQQTEASIIKRSTRKMKDMELPTGLVNNMFAIKIQQGTNAYMLSNGDYALAVVESVIPAADPEKDASLAASLADIHQNLQLVMQNEIIEEYTRYLETKYPVSINENVLRAVMK